MASRRAIKSDIWDDEWFGELTQLSQLVWIGLFSRMADDQGRLLDNPSLIASRLFPYRTVPVEDIEACLNEFDGHIQRYEVDGRRYIQIVKWWQNQPMEYAVPSCYPAPEGWEDRYRTTYKKQYIVYNWPRQKNTELGDLVRDAVVRLGRVSTWTDYLRALNSVFNTNTVKREDRDSENNSPDPSEPESDPPAPDDHFSRVQQAIESITGMMPDGKSAVDAIREIVKMGALRPDIEAAYAWLRDQGKTFRYYSQLVGPTRTAMAKRVGEERRVSGVDADGLTPGQRALYGSPR